MDQRANDLRTASQSEDAQGLVEFAPHKGWVVRYCGAAGGWMVIQIGVPRPQPPLSTRSYQAAVMVRDILGGER